MACQCARCGASAARNLHLPSAWAGYLADERGLVPKEGRLTVPLCVDCHGAVADVVLPDEEVAGDAAAAGGTEPAHAVGAVLDELAVDRIVTDP